MVAREAEHAGSTVLYGSCSEDLGAPYEPFLESLGHAVTHLSTDVLAAQVEVHGDVLTRLNGRPLDQPADLIALVRKYPPGQAVTVIYQRGGVSHTVPVTLTWTR